MLRARTNREYAMSSRRQAFGIAAVSILPFFSVYAADGAAAPDVSGWACASCPYNYGWSGTGSLGFEGVTNGNYRFGEYSGYDHKGLYLAADGDAAFRDKNGYFFDVAGGNLGLDSRWIDLSGGRQGLFELHGMFREIPQFQFDAGQTPYLGAGGSNQTLPANWVYGGSTAQMTSLPAALQPVGIGNRRRTVDLGADFTPSSSNWDLLFDFRHDLQTGTKITGANFLTTSTQLATPLDYRTDQIDASAGYSRDTWQVRVGYYGSFFSDGNATVEWTNPFMPIVPGTSQGRMSLAPSNAFNQLSLTGGWQILRSTRIMASLAYGREMQDSAFMPSTINPTLTTPALPAGSLDGIVDTGNYVVRLTSSPWRHLSLTGEYLIDRRDNKTPQNVYPQVNTDTFVAASQTNLPYSFDREDAKLNAAYRIMPQLKLQAGGEQERFDRSFEAALRTRTNSVWGEINSSFTSGVDLSLKYSHAQRRFENYQPVTQASSVDNPLLRQFDLANRAREQWLATAAYALSPKFGIDVTLQQDDDKYSDSPIGLTSDKDYSGTLDADWKPTDKISSDAYITRQYIKSEQASSQSFSVPDWSGTNDVVIDTVGISGQWLNALPGVDLGSNYSFSYSRESIAVATGTAETPFPNNAVNNMAAKLWSRYHVNPRCTIRFEYAYERLDTSDWALDGVEPNTVSNVLALGVNSPRYKVNVLGMRFQYGF